MIVKTWRRLMLMVLLALLMAACGAPTAEQAATAIPGMTVIPSVNALTPTPPPALLVPTPTLAKPSPTPVIPTPLATASPPPPTPTPTATPGSLRSQAQVLRVVDGDTIEVSIAGNIYKIRYIGVDTPETVDPRKSVQCFGQEASVKNKELVGGKTVQLEKDVSETDRYGRLLRYVYIGDTMINAELVSQGYARASSYPPDVKHEDLFRQLEAEARDQGRGLWAPGACLTPEPASTATAKPVVTDSPKPLATTPPAAATSTPATAKPGNCDPSYPDVCIPPPPPDLNCKDVPYKRFRVLQPDPHGFDGNKDGIGCQ